MAVPAGGLVRFDSYSSTMGGKNDATIVSHRSEISLKAFAGITNIYVRIPRPEQVLASVEGVVVATTHFGHGC